MVTVQTRSTSTALTLEHLSMVGLRTQRLLASTKITVSVKFITGSTIDFSIRLHIYRHSLILSRDYPNSQNGRTLWYHDHSISLTAENSYFGQAGFYLIRDPEEQNMPGLPQGTYRPASSDLTLLPFNVRIQSADSHHQANTTFQSLSPQSATILTVAYGAR